MNAPMIEHADDQGSNRLASAMASLLRWYKREEEVASRSVASARQRLLMNPDDAETRDTLRTLESGLSSLREGFRHSSVRRHFDGNAEQRVAVAEERVAAAAPSRGLAAEPRAATKAATKTTKEFTGYAAKYNSVTTIAGVFRESIAPGAFDAVVKTADCRFLYNHDPNFIYGRTVSNTLEIWSDRVGLGFRCYALPFDGPTFQLAQRVDRGDVSQCSFAFVVGEDRWKLAKSYGDLDERVLVRIDQLLDVSAVVYPAYAATSVGVTFMDIPARSAEQDLDDYARQAEAEELAQWERKYEDDRRREQIDSLCRQLGLRPTRKTDMEEQYRRAGEILAKCSPRSGRN